MWSDCVKRHALKLLVFLLLGAIINVAVAWACALTCYPIPSSKPLKGWFASRDNPNHGFIVLKYDRFGSTWVKALSSTRRTESDDAGAICPYWSVFPAVLHQRESRTLANQANGWPLRSLSCRLDLGRDAGGNPEWLAHQALQLPDSFPVDPTYVFLPYDPIAAGFAINTIFYAAILWMMFVMPFAIRRRRRIKRGVCPACAYPVGTTERCTECGRPQA